MNGWEGDWQLSAWKEQLPSEVSAAYESIQWRKQSSSSLITSTSYLFHFSTACRISCDPWSYDTVPLLSITRHVLLLSLSGVILSRKQYPNKHYFLYLSPFGIYCWRVTMSHHNSPILVTSHSYWFSIEIREI